jgi:preprotein translocase subunit SecY
MKSQKVDTVAKRIRFTFFIIMLLRLGNLIPIPYLDQRDLITILDVKPWFKRFFNNKTLILNIFTLGIIPSFNASAVIQVLTNISPDFEKLQKEEGETGRRKIKQYTRLFTLVFSIIGSLSILFTIKPILFNCNIGTCFQICLTLTTGSMVVLWLSDLITENGIGNGSAIVISLNVFSALPNTLIRLEQLGPLTLLTNLIGFIILIIGIIYLQSAIRSIPLISAKQLLAEETNQIKQPSFLPLALNQGGVMPIIFSSSCLGYLSFIINSLIPSKNFWVQLSESKILGICYGGINFFLILIFSQLYSDILLNAKEIAKDLNRKAVTIPNIRPGKKTAQFLYPILKRVSFLGGIFLASLVTLPNIPNSDGFEITSLMILIGTVIDARRQIQTLLISQNY